MGLGQIHQGLGALLASGLELSRPLWFVLLAEVYTWFTAGFDTVDLQEAQVVLEALT